MPCVLPTRQILWWLVFTVEQPRVLLSSAMQSPLHRPHHQQYRRAKFIDQMLSADASKEHGSVPGQSPSIGNRLSQDFRYLLVRKLLMGRNEQHDRHGSVKPAGEQEENALLPFRRQA
jgi:hypothetical protein